MKSETIIIRTTKVLKDKLTELADKDKRSLSNYVRIILEEKISEPYKCGRCNGVGKVISDNRKKIIDCRYCD